MDVLENYCVISLAQVWTEFQNKNKKKNTKQNEKEHDEKMRKSCW